MIFFHNRKVNRQNYPKSIFLNASIKAEASFLQFGYNYSILLIKSGIFHSIGSNSTVVLTAAKGSNRITVTDTEEKVQEKAGIVLHYQTTRGSLFNKSSHNSNCNSNYA